MKQTNIRSILLLALAGVVSNVSHVDGAVSSYARLAVLKGTDGEYCVAAKSRNPFEGSKLKVAKCKSEDDRQLFVLDGRRWRLDADTSLCVDVSKTQVGKSLYLKKCKGGGIGDKRQKWRFGDEIRTKPDWSICPALAISSPKPGAPIKLANCADNEDKLFHFDKPSTSGGGKCQRCEKKYDIENDQTTFLCDERQNKYCQFYVYLDLPYRSNCKNYCKDHGGSCLKAFANEGMKNNGCEIKEQRPCSENMADGICRCTADFDALQIADCDDANQGGDNDDDTDDDNDGNDDTDDEKCPSCEKKYEVAIDEICKEKQNKYCQFYVALNNYQNNCKTYCKEHGGSCIKAFSNDGMKNNGCEIDDQIPCNEVMGDGICRCSMPTDCDDANQDDDDDADDNYDTADDTNQGKDDYYHIVPYKKCSKCGIYDDEGDSDKIVARDRGNFANNAKWCNNGSWKIEDVDGGFRLRKIGKFDSKPGNSCATWTDEWWCSKDSGPSIGELGRCQDGNDKQVWKHNDKGEIRSKFKSNYCLTYGKEVGCAIGRSILLKKCDGSSKQKWKFVKRKCSGDTSK